MVRELNSTNLQASEITGQLSDSSLTVEVREGCEESKTRCHF